MSTSVRTLPEVRRFIYYKVEVFGVVKARCISRQRTTPSRRRRTRRRTPSTGSGGRAYFPRRSSPTLGPEVFDGHAKAAGQSQGAGDANVGAALGEQDGGLIHPAPVGHRLETQPPV